jgi:pimeloyl-ACP methyl ester carboxylesterase
VEAGEITVPTLYVWSSADAGVGHAAAAGTAAWVAAPYRFETFDQVSHWIPDEAPDRLSAELLAHLEHDGD